MKLLNYLLENSLDRLTYRFLNLFPTVNVKSFLNNKYSTKILNKLEETYIIQKHGAYDPIILQYVDPKKWLLHLDNIIF